MIVNGDLYKIFGTIYLGQFSYEETFLRLGSLKCHYLLFIWFILTFKKC